MEENLVQSMDGGAVHRQRTHRSNERHSTCRYDAGTEHQVVDTKGASFGFIQQSSQKQGSPESNNRGELKQKVAAPSAYLAKVEWLHCAGPPSLSSVPCGGDTASRWLPTHWGHWLGLTAKET